jgi:hypothetical protein
MKALMAILTLATIVLAAPTFARPADAATVSPASSSYGGGG